MGLNFNEKCVIIDILHKKCVYSQKSRVHTVNLPKKRTENKNVICNYHAKNWSVSGTTEVNIILKTGIGCLNFEFADPGKKVTNELIV